MSNTKLQNSLLLQNEGEKVSVLAFRFLLKHHVLNDFLLWLQIMQFTILLFACFNNSCSMFHRKFRVSFVNRFISFFLSLEEEEAL